MSARVLTPPISGWVIGAATACWLGLTALSVILGDRDGFLAAMAGRLTSTAAGVVLGITGVGAVVQIWQRHQMRQRTGPYVMEAISDAIDANGLLVACYTGVGSSALPGASAMTARSATALLAPPLRHDEDLAPFYRWAYHARQNYLRMAGEGLAETTGFTRAQSNDDAASPAEPGAPGLTAADRCLVASLRQQLSTWDDAAARFHDAVSRLVDFDAPRLAPVVEGSLDLRAGVARQKAAVTEDHDEQSAAELSWLACSQIMSAAISLADGFDSMFRAMQKSAGRRMNPLQRALNDFSISMQRQTKDVVLVNDAAVLAHRSFLEQMAAADSHFDRPEARARRQRIEMARERRRKEAKSDTNFGESDDLDQ